MAKEKFKIISVIAKFFRESKSEIKKVVWPTPGSVFKNTGVVLSTIFIIGLFVFLLDVGLTSLLRLIMEVSPS